MLDPPADRLDERGYDTISVTKHGKHTVEWSSTTYVDEEGFNVGETVRVTDKAGRVLSVSVGDVVYLSGPRKGQPAEIGKVKVLFQEPADGNEAGYFWLDVRAPRAARAPRPVDRRPQDVAVKHRARARALYPSRRLARNGDGANVAWFEVLGRISTNFSKLQVSPPHR